MRNDKTWERIKGYKIERLSPRLQQDVIAFPVEKGSPVENCFIYGISNSGKTVLAAAKLVEELRQLYFQGVDDAVCSMVSVPELVEALKQEFDKKENLLLPSMYDCHLLVLDDLGVDKPTDWVLQRLYLVINHRYEYLKKTIITSNKSLEELADMFGDDRITSRIERMGIIVRKKPWNDKE